MKRVVLVTGCNGGIGRAICSEFLGKGWKVIGVDIQSLTFERELSQNEFIFFQIDITKQAALERLVYEVNRQEGNLNALINNAAIQICKPFYSMNDKEWNDLIDINLKAPFWLVKQFYPLLKTSKGSVVNISSVHAVATSDQIAAYATSKGGLSAMTRALSVECAKDGIRINAVQPGAIDTEMLREGIKRGSKEKNQTEEEQLRGLGLKHLIGRVGKPNEVAKSVYFLADNEQSSFITGQCLTIDGGATIKLSTE